MQEVRLPSIRRGYPYQADFNFPAGFLADGETLRAELRRTPAQSTASKTFAVERDGNTVTLSLSAGDTANLAVRFHLMDLTLVMSAGAEEPLREPRFLILVEDHVTRPAA